LQPDDAEMGFDAVPLPLAARLEDLERRLDWESDARLALMDEIDALRAELDAVATAASADEPRTRLEELARAARAALGRDGEVSPAREPGALAAEVAERVAERRRRFQPTPEELEQRRIQRFVDAGITPDRAEWIAQRTAELQMQA